MPSAGVHPIINLLGVQWPIGCASRTKGRHRSSLCHRPTSTRHEAGDKFSCRAASGTRRSPAFSAAPVDLAAIELLKDRRANMISAAFPYQKQRRRVLGSEMAYVE